MGKPITIDVQAKLALKNQTDVIKGFVDDIDSAFGDLDISDALRASFDKSLTGINKTFVKIQSLFGKSIFNERDLKKSATYIDSIATALAGIEYKVKTSTAESLGLGSKELAQARKELKTLNQERNKALNKSAANVLDADSLDKFMQLSKGGFSGEKSLSKNLADIESAAAKAQGSIASLGQELNKLKDEQDVAKKQEDSFKAIEERYKNYLKLQKQKTAASSFADVKTRFRKKEEVTADYNNLIAQQITDETIKSGEGHVFAQAIGEWLELTPAEIDSFATQSASVIVKTLQDKVSLFLSSTKDGGKGINALFNKAIEASNIQLDDSIVKEYTDAKTATEKYSSQSDYNEKIEKLQNSIKEATELINLINSLKAELEVAAKSHAEAVNKEYDDIIDKQKKEVNELNERDKESLYQKINANKAATSDYVTTYNKEVDKVELKHQTQAEAAKAEAEAKAFKANLQASIKHWMGAQQVITLVKQGIRQAYQDIQGLDKAMTNIAVVTGFSVSDLWGKINEYMSIAQQYGVTTQGVYEVSQLYFQQGLGEAETMELTTETLKMARIAGMDYADAADGMTVAIRGFKMEMEDAARVTDVYSKVAAVTASDSQEIIEAMSKTASSAASVGSGFEETTAMLAVMIEATREAPTNIGSAMKSIISRYGEMTKGMTVDTDGEEIAFNKVDTALQSVGVSIKDATGQFREFDDVIYELAGKWETLDSLSQRYVATVFAGNRQQSRFLALMSNYDRLVEVTENAQNSEDAGLLQYSKTLDSLETKLNNIKTSFQQFYMDIFNGPVIGAGLEFINNLIKGFNKLGKVTSIFNIVNIVKGIKQLANIGVNSFSGIGSSITQSIKNGFSQATLIAFQAGKEHKQAYQSGWNDGAAPTTQNQTSVFSGKGKALVNMAVIGGGALSAIGSAWSSKNAIAGSITSGIGNIISGAGQGAIMGASMGSILGPYGTAIGAAVGGVANALGSIPGIVEAFNNRLQEKADQAAEKAEKSNIKRAETREKVRGLEDGIKDLEELGKKRFDSDEDMQAWLDANNALFEKFPELVVKFDEAGNSIVSLTSAEAELTAAREAASKAAKQAAADEYDKAITELEIVKARKLDTGDAFDGKATNVLYLPSAQGKALKDAGGTFVSPNLLDIYGRYTVNNVGQELISQPFMRLLQSGLDFTDVKTASWTVSLKNLNAEQMTSALLNNLIAGSVKLLDGLTIKDVIDNYTGIENSKLLQDYNEKTADLNAANRYVDATRASKIAAESASALSGIEEQYEELESANEAIQAQIIKQFSFDDQGKKITGEIDSNEVVEASQELGEEFTELYTSLINSGKVDEFNELVQKALTGQITESAFIKQLEALNVGEAIQKAYLAYVKDNMLLTPADFEKALGEKTGDYSALKVFSEEGKELTEQNYKDIIDNEVEFLEAQIEAGKITATQADKYAAAYAEQISAFGDKQNLIDIFTSGDLTSLKGIQDTEAALQEAGWSETLEWSQFISTAMINFTTSYESLMEGVANSITKTTELFDKASEEMNIEAAQEIAGALGKDVSVFDTTYFERIGESFYATNTAINTLIDQQTKDINKEIANYTSALQTELEKIENFQETPETSFYEQYSDTAETALKWAKEQRLAGYENIESAKYISTTDLKELITKYYGHLQTTATEGAEKYITDLEAQLEAEFDLVVTGRDAKSKIVADGIKGLGDKVQVGQEELAYALLVKLSQDITSSLDEAEYALFAQLFGAEYLAADGMGEWKVESGKIKDFIKNAQNLFGIFGSTLVNNSLAYLEETIESTLSDAASLGEEIGGEGRKTIGKEELFKLVGDKITNFEEVYEDLLYYINAGAYGSFGSLLSAYSGGAFSSEEGTVISQELLKGVNRGFNDFTENLVEEKIKYITGQLTEEDLDNISSLEGGAEKVVELKDTLPKEIDNWAEATIQQKIDAIDAVLSQEVTDQNITELEKAEQLEKYSVELLDAEYGLLTSQEKALQEARDILIETGGKNLTSEQVAALSRAGEEIYVTATASGYQVDKSKLSEESQSLIDRYYDTITQNAVEGAENLLTAAVKKTLTGAEVQDYFKDLDIDIDYITAEDWAKLPVDKLLENILNTFIGTNIEIDNNKLNEIISAILDSILESISSGISSLGAGLEGTLGAADYQALVTKYGLTGSSTLTSKGVRLSREDQNILNRKLAYEAKQNGMIEGYGDQLWEVWRDSDNDPFEGYNDLGPAIEEAVKYAESLKDETQEAQDEAWAYVEALQQARHAAMFDEDSVEFAFMEQDATDGLTKNFDSFVNSIDKVKSALQGLKDTGKIGYNDFFNIIDYLGETGQWKQVATNMGLAEKFVEDYKLFGTEMASTTETIGQIDAKSFASIGMDVSTAATAMADGMNEGLKETARSQIEYLSGIEQMLLALQALEGIGDVDLGLGLTFGINGKPVEINNLKDIVNYWDQLSEDQQTTLVAVLKTKLENGNSPADKILQEFFGNNFSLFDLLGGKDFFNLENFDIEAIKAITALSNLTENQAKNLAMNLEGEIGLKEGTDYTIDENSVITYTQEAYKKIIEYFKNNYKDFYKIADVPIDFDVQTKINAKLNEAGIQIQGNQIQGEITEEIIQKVKQAYEEEGIQIEISEAGKISLLSQGSETLEAGKTDVSITPNFILPESAPGTLNDTIQSAFGGAPITIDVPVVVNPVQYDITEIQEKIGILGKDSPFIAAWQNALNTLKNVVPINATADITWSTLINTTNDIASIIQNNIVQPILIPITATPVITWNNPTISIATFRQLAQAEINKQYELLKIEPEKMEPIETIFDIAVKIKEVTGLTESDIKTAWDQNQANKGTTITIGDVTVTIPEINNVEGIDSTKISDFLKDKPIDDVLVFVSILAQLGQGKNGVSPIEYAAVIEEVQKAFTKNPATPVDVETIPTAILGDNPTIGVDEILSAVTGYVFTPVDVRVPVTISVSLTDKNIFQKELEKYKETFFSDGFGTFAEDIDLDAFLNDPMTQAFGKFFDSFSGESLFDAIKNSIFGNDSGLKPEDIAMDNFFAEATGEYQKVIESISSLPETISAITTEVDSSAFSEIASYLSQAATSAEALKDALTVIGGLTLGGLAGNSESNQQEGLEGQAENLQTVSGELTNINSLGDPLQQTAQGATLANVPLLEIIYSLINTVTQLNQIKSNDALKLTSEEATQAMESIMAIDGAVEALRTGLQEQGPVIAESLKAFESQGAIELATNIDKTAQSLQTIYDLLSQVGEDGINPLITLFSGGLFGQTEESGAEGGIFTMLEQLSTLISTLDASQITAIATAISSISTNATTASTSMTSLQKAISGLQTIKTKIELETNAEDVKDEIQSIINAISQIDTAIGIGVAQSGSEDATDALTDVDEAENSIARNIDISVSETGSQQVAEKLREVDEIENNIARNITIKVKAEGAPEAIGMLNSIKGATGTDPKVTGTVNNISGNALAEGNVLRRHLLPGANLANKTLVGELGPELAVYNGKYHLLGAGGAEFVTLPKGALVFNHLQTRGILNGQMNGARAETYQSHAKSIQDRMHGSAMATGNVSGPALAGGIGGALAAVRRAKSVWQGLLNSLSAADLLGGGGGGGGGGGNDESLKAHIEDLQEWYNLSRKIADIEQQINTLLAKRENITNGHEYLKNLRATQALLEDQVNTQTDLMRFQEKQLKAQADFINNHDIWSKFLNVDENGLLQYNEGNETNGGKGALKVLQELNEMSGSQQLKYITKTLGWSYTNTDGEELEDEELVAKFFEELQKQIDDYDALHDTVAETTEKLEELETEINEIEKEIRENEINLSQEIYDIIVDAWKENIENLKEQNELIKEANDAYAEGIQKALDAEKEQYEENRSIEEREQLQRQLSLLRRSGGSASEIADLEQQLDETLKDEYFRNQEQALEKIRDANERQVELMEQQVKIQEDSLAYQQEQGVIWQKVYEVMQGTDAEILDFMQGNSTEFFEKSSLVQQDMLAEWAKMVGIYNEDKVRDYYTAQAEENINQAWDTERGKGLKGVYDSASKKDRDNWNREYYEQYAKAMMEGATETEALTKAQEELYEHLEEYKKTMEEKAKEEKKKSGGGGGGSSGSGSSGTKYYYIKDPETGKFYGVNSNDKKSAQAYVAKKAAQAGLATTSSGNKTSVIVNSNNAGGRSKDTSSKNIEALKKKVSSSSRYTGTANSIGPARYGGTLVGEFGMELGVWNDKWHLMGKNGPEMRNDIPSDALIFNHLQTAGILQGQYSSDFFSRKLSDIPNQLNDSYNSAISGITNNSDSSNLTIEPGAVVVQVQQLNDRYDIDELYNDITDRIYAIASQSSGRGVSRR